MTDRSPRRRTAMGAVCLAVLVAGGCAGGPRASYDFRVDQFEGEVAEQSAPLGGEALLQMKRRMERAHGDLKSFRLTLESLEAREDGDGMTLFAGFIDAYVGLHLVPLLRSEWQSKHPELMGLDANLRIAQAQIYTQLRDPARVGDVLEEIERRHSGRQNLLVEYPRDETTTLGKAVEGLREGRWRG